MCSQTHKFRKPDLEIWVASTDHMADQLIREAMIEIHFFQICVVLREVILNILCSFCNKDFIKVCAHILFYFFNSDNEKSGYNENQTCGYTTLWSGYDFKNMILKLQNVNVLYSLKTLSGGNNLNVRCQRTHVNTPSTKFKTPTKLHKFNCGRI